MDLQVGEHSHIEFKGRPRAAGTFARRIDGGKQIELPMFEWHRFRVIGQERRAGEGGYRKSGGDPHEEHYEAYQPDTGHFASAEITNPSRVGNIDALQLVNKPKCG